jgi:hypothetical protein
MQSNSFKSYDGETDLCILSSDWKELIENLQAALSYGCEGVDVGLLGGNAEWTCRKTPTFQRNTWKQYVSRILCSLPASAQGGTSFLQQLRLSTVTHSIWCISAHAWGVRCARPPGSFSQHKLSVESSLATQHSARMFESNFPRVSS